jgi:SnoaL-like domain
LDGNIYQESVKSSYQVFMPNPEILNRFIARVEANAHTEAIAEFYTANATMQENMAPPRQGRAKLVAHEAAVMARAKSLTSECVRPVFVSGDRVVIRWIFNFVWADGSTSHIEELAYQRWEGERIAEETFFYDPVQMKPIKPLGPEAAAVGG